MNYLARLIQERMADQRWSLADVSARAGTRPDGKPALPRTTLHALIRRPEGKLPPKPATLNALVKGLGLPRDVIHHAAARDAGYELPDIGDLPVAMSKYQDMRIIADLAEDLTPEEFAEIRRIAEREADRILALEPEAKNGD